MDTGELISTGHQFFVLVKVTSLSLWMRVEIAGELDDSHIRRKGAHLRDRHSSSKRVTGDHKPTSQAQSGMAADEQSRE